MDKKNVLTTRLCLEMASDHMMEYYAFHWPPKDLQVLFEDEKGVFYITHKRMGGLLITVKPNYGNGVYMVRSYKNQYSRAKTHRYINMQKRLREKGYLNGNA